MGRRSTDRPSDALLPASNGAGSSSIQRPRRPVDGNYGRWPPSGACRPPPRAQGPAWLATAPGRGRPAPRAGRTTACRTSSASFGPRRGRRRGRHPVPSATRRRTSAHASFVVSVGKPLKKRVLPAKKDKRTGLGAAGGRDELLERRSGTPRRAAQSRGRGVRARAAGRAEGPVHPAGGSHAPRRHRPSMWRTAASGTSSTSLPSTILGGVLRRSSRRSGRCTGRRPRSSTATSSRRTSFCRTCSRTTRWRQRQRRGGEGRRGGAWFRPSSLSPPPRPGSKRPRGGGEGQGEGEGHGEADEETDEGGGGGGGGGGGWWVAKLGDFFVR